MEAARVAFSAAEDLSAHLLTVPQDLLAYKDVLSLLEVGCRKTPETTVIAHV